MVLQIPGKLAQRLGAPPAGWRKVCKRGRMTGCPPALLGLANSGVPGDGSAAYEAALGRAEVSGVEEVAAVRAESGVAGPEARFCARRTVALSGCGHGTQRRLPPREAAAGPGSRACGECDAGRSRAAGKGSRACSPSSGSSAG